jgi:hypothetical protein
MPKGKGYKMSSSRTVSKTSPKPRSYSKPSGRVSSGKKKFNSQAYSRMRTKVFGLAKKEDAGKV